MKILITGADRPLGKMAARHFMEKHALRLSGLSPREVAGFSESDYVQADLRQEEAAASLLEDVDAILHLANFNAPECESNQDELDALEHAATGTYFLTREARKAGVERIIIGGSLRIFDFYPDEFLIDEMWKPHPSTNISQLAPYLSESVAREFVREGGICGMALRFMPIGEDSEKETRSADAMAALEKALAYEFQVPGYRWHVFHVASSERFIMRNARMILGMPRKEKA